MVRTFNACGLLSDSTPVRPAINLVGTRRNSASRLHWNPFPDTAAVSYAVQRSANGSPWQTLATQTDTNYLDTPQRCGYVYAYRIQLVTANSNNGALSDTFQTVGLDTIPPPPPVVHFATVQTSHPTLGKIMLEFEAPPDANRMGYWIYRTAQNGSSTSFFWANPTAGTLQFIDQNLDTRGKYYSYFIRSVDSCSGNQSPMSEVHTTQNLSATAVNAAINLTWTPYAGFGQDSVVVMRRTFQTAWIKRRVLVGNQTSFWFSIRYSKSDNRRKILKLFQFVCK
jgi:hypothetical protein